MKVLARNVVVLALHHAAKGREEAFGGIYVLAVQVAVHFAVVDAASLVVHFEAVPMAGFVCEDDGLGGNASLCVLCTYGFRLANKGDGAAIALA